MIESKELNSFLECYLRSEEFMNWVIENSFDDEQDFSGLDFLQLAETATEDPDEILMTFVKALSDFDESAVLNKRSVQVYECVNGELFALLKNGIETEKYALYHFEDDSCFMYYKENSNLVSYTIVQLYMALTVLRAFSVYTNLMWDKESE